MTRSIALLGSTGSIGRQTLEVARELGLSVAALTANKSVDLIEQQAREFCPRLAVLYDEDAARELRARLSDTNTQVLSGMEGLLAAATADDADTVVTAVMGMIGLQPPLAAVEKKKRIALANKETLVCAGELVVAAAERCGAEIVPVDSEHSAIFQCLQGCRDRGEIKRLILTCSGGPFYGLSAQELALKTKADALKHPNWTMGAKITIDSATLMNKALEMVEKALVKNAHNVKARGLKGYLLRKLGMLQASEKWNQESLKLDAFDFVSGYEQALCRKSEEEKRNLSG